QVENSLEIQVPRGEPQLAVKHRDTIAHIVKGDAQLGLALADLVEQPRIVHRNYGLRGEALQQSHLFVPEPADLRTSCRKVAQQTVVLARGYKQTRMKPAKLCHRLRDRMIDLCKIGKVDKRDAIDQRPGDRVGQSRKALS